MPRAIPREPDRGYAAPPIVRAGDAETSFGGGTAVDANGYVQTAPLPANAQLGVRLTGMTATALTLTLPSGLPSGDRHRVRHRPTGTGTQKLQALVCVDNMTGTGGGGLLASCATISK